RQLERALAELDGAAETVLFPSGMAAVTAVLFAVLGAGDTLVVPADGYYAVRPLAADWVARFGIAVRQVPTPGPYLLDGAALVLLETPSNPGLDVCDLAAVSAAAHRAGALVAVDNTTATPLGQRPLDLGADLVLASDTKALAGHSDLLLGHASTRDAELAARLRDWRTHAGSIPGPFEAWLAHRPRGTLARRRARRAATALALAELLRGRPEVAGLRYPGLPGDPAHPVAARQMRRFGGVLSCTFPDAPHVDRLLAASRLVVAATSFGGLHTTPDRPARGGGGAVPPGIRRVPAGAGGTAAPG